MTNPLIDLGAIDSFVQGTMDRDEEVVHRVRNAALTGLAVGAAVEYFGNRPQPQHFQTASRTQHYTQYRPQLVASGPPRHVQPTGALKWGYAFISLLFIIFAWAFGSTGHPQALWSLVVLSSLSLVVMAVDRK